MNEWMNWNERNGTERNGTNEWRTKSPYIVSCPSFFLGGTVRFAVHKCVWGYCPFVGIALQCLMPAPPPSSSRQQAPANQSDSPRKRLEDHEDLIVYSKWHYVSHRQSIKRDSTTQFSSKTLCKPSGRAAIWSLTYTSSYNLVESNQTWRKPT